MYTVVTNKLQKLSQESHYCSLPRHHCGDQKRMLVEKVSHLYIQLDLAQARARRLEWMVGVSAAVAVGMLAGWWMG